MVLDLERRAELFPVLADGSNTMRTDGDHLHHFAFPDVFDVGFGKLREEIIVAQAANRITGALLLPEHAERNPEVPEHLHEREHDFATLRVIGAHTTQP